MPSLLLCSARNRMPLSLLLAAGFQRSLNTYSALPVQSGLKLAANNHRLKNVFKKKLDTSTNLTHQQTSFQIGLGLCFPSQMLESDLPLLQRLLCLCVDTPRSPFQTHPSIALLPVLPTTQKAWCPCPVPQHAISINAALEKWPWWMSGSARPKLLCTHQALTSCGHTG